MGRSYSWRPIGDDGVTVVADPDGAADGRKHTMSMSDRTGRVRIHADGAAVYVRADDTASADAGEYSAVIPSGQTWDLDYPGADYVSVYSTADAVIIQQGQ